MTHRLLLLTELERIVGNCCRIIQLMRPEHKDYRPQENMRDMSELANHLAQIPAVDLKIMRGAEENEVIELENQLTRPNPNGWCEVMEEGLADLHRFMEKLTLNEFENSTGTAFYGRTQTYAQWLLEVITHIYHHRSQLFTYMKLNGYDVNTATLYDS